MEVLSLFNLSTEEIEKLGATHTTQEIHRQPDVWRELFTNFFKEQAKYKEFLESIYNKHDHVRVIMTGAGTSAFIGDTLAPELSRLGPGHVSFESIPTTDIVSNPTEYLTKDQPTILASFARSGNSPESVATVALAEKIVDDFYQVVITCNEEGELARNVQDDPNSITLIMPERSNDQSLAMTSSFSTMVAAAFALFTDQVYTEEVTERIISIAEKFVDQLGDIVDDVLTFDFNRVVFLGSGLLAQLSHEAALKMLELSDGKVVAMHESSLGFRHGPKSVLNDESMVVLFMSQDPYTRKYDFDILKELSAAEFGMKIIALTEKEDEEVEELADWTIVVNPEDDPVENDLNLALIYVIFAQTLALKKSIQLGISPDNPSPDGAINRVVQGVTIYDYDE